MNKIDQAGTGHALNHETRFDRLSQYLTLAEYQPVPDELVDQCKGSLSEVWGAVLHFRSPRGIMLKGRQLFSLQAVSIWRVVVLAKQDVQEVEGVGIFADQ